LLLLGLDNSFVADKPSRWLLLRGEDTVVIINDLTNDTYNDT